MLWHQSEGEWAIESIIVGSEGSESLECVSASESIIRTADGNALSTSGTSKRKTNMREC